jgi:hypothetical protein
VPHQCQSTRPAGKPSSETRLLLELYGPKTGPRSPIAAGTSRGRCRALRDYWSSDSLERDHELHAYCAADRMVESAGHSSTATAGAEEYN